MSTLKIAMRRRLLIAAFLTTAAFFIAHLINLMVAHALTRSADVELVTPRPGNGFVPVVDRLRLAEEILVSGMFGRPQTSGLSGLGPRGMGSTGQVGTTSSPGPPIDAAKKVKLIGTVAGDARVSMAVVEEVGSKKQALYHLHDLIPAVGEIGEIRKDAILIRQGMQEELLQLVTGMPVRPPAAQAAVIVAPVGMGSTLQRVLDRREVAQSMADLPKLLSQARASAFYVNGKQDGWRIESLAPQSFYEKIGLRPGDVLQRLNGIELRDPGMLLAFFQQVKDERMVTLDLIRDERKTTLSYELR
ncbi:MAG: hypothetical protein H0X01_05295 [Nitrospira sp.]|nr:hypothetical protein [Nitrospira sp.]